MAPLSGTSALVIPCNQRLMSLVVPVTSPDGSELKEQDISPAALFPPEWEAESSSEGEPRGIPARPSGKIRLSRRGS